MSNSNGRMELSTKKRKFAQYSQESEDGEDAVMIDADPTSMVPTASAAALPVLNPQKRLHTGPHRLWEHFQLVDREAIVRTFWEYAQAPPTIHVLRYDLVLIQAQPTNEGQLNAFLVRLGTIATEHHFCNESRLQLFLNMELPATVDFFNKDTQYHIFVAGYGVNATMTDAEDDMTQLLYVGTAKYRLHSCSEPATVIYRLYLELYNPNCLSSEDMDQIRQHICSCPVNKYGSPVCDHAYY